MAKNDIETMRAADTDRQKVADQLKGALDEGRLTLHEYDERVALAYSAKTYEELLMLLTDLPRPGLSASEVRARHEAGVPGVVVVPIGFVSDHMEVIYDLDTEARETAEEIGLPFARAATAGVDPRFVAMARDLLLERAAVEADQPEERTVERAAVGSPASWDVCPVGCCPNPRGARPALCGQD